MCNRLRLTRMDADRTISRIFLKGKAPTCWLGSHGRHLEVEVFYALATCRHQREITGPHPQQRHGLGTTRASGMDTVDKEVAGWDGT